MPATRTTSPAPAPTRRPCCSRLSCSPTAAASSASSRAIERACREQVTFIALSGDSAPHFATFAAFVSTLGAEIVPLFKEVLLICDRQGLIGREMFAIDGVKLPSNASKARSGTRADFQRQADKMEAAAQAMLARHRENDALPVEADLAAKEARHIERLTMEAARMRQWLTANPEERKGAKGKVVKSNRTDNESAKMATSKQAVEKRPNALRYALRATQGER